MSMGNNPADGGDAKMKLERFMARADADRAAHLAGHKPLLRRLLERLRPRRQDPR
jgi:hypothetical protein